MIEFDRIHTNIAKNAQKNTVYKIPYLLSSHKTKAVSPIRFLDRHFECTASISFVKDR